MECSYQSHFNNISNHTSKFKRAMAVLLNL
uniref:Uncharacterized protein n=1 Tax=Anguilla anguilla TaxID=7936 RepID=A0A0E9S049_ANGAN